MVHIARLPGPAADHWEWQFDAACLGSASATFFHPDRERGPARRDRDAVALTICRECPVIERCRQHALTVREPYGVWGGLTEKQRQALYRRAPVPPAADDDPCVSG